MNTKPLIYLSILILIGSLISCTVGYHKEGSGFEDFKNAANLAVNIAHRNELERANREIQISQIVNPGAGAAGTAIGSLISGKSNVTGNALTELRAMGWQPCKENQYSECYNFRVSGSFIGTLFADCFVVDQKNAPSSNSQQLNLNNNDVNARKTPQKSINPNYPFANKVSGKEGFVFSPYSNRLVDVVGIQRGTLVKDPTSQLYFRVP